jgi:hypothetical protein
MTDWDWDEPETDQQAKTKSTPGRKDPRKLINRKQRDRVRRKTSDPTYWSSLPRCFPYVARITQVRADSIIRQVLDLDLYGFALTSSSRTRSGLVDLWLSQTTAAYLVDNLGTLSQDEIQETRL